GQAPHHRVDQRRSETPGKGTDLTERRTKLGFATCVIQSRALAKLMPGSAPVQVTARSNLASLESAENRNSAIVKRLWTTNESRCRSASRLPWWRTTTKSAIWWNGRNLTGMCWPDTAF